MTVFEKNYCFIPQLMESEEGYFLCERKWALQTGALEGEREAENAFFPLKHEPVGQQIDSGSVSLWV